MEVNNESERKKKLIMTNKSRKCPYCHHGEQGFIKPLIRYTGETGDMDEMDYHEAALDIEHNQLYIQGYVPNLGEYCFETDANYCPKCGGKLAKNEN